MDDSTASDAQGVASEDGSETVAQTGQRIEAAHVAAGTTDRGAAQGQLVHGAANPVAVPASVPATLPADLSVEAAGTPPVPPADPKSSSNQGTTDQGGTTQMDPEPCPWSQKNGSTN